jgi:hypothetical protein
LIASDDEGRHGRHHNSTLEDARLLALLNLAIADAAIGCWEAKYTYVFWRPVTAIPLADTDGNPATIADPTWMPLFATPAHPEYPSGNSCVSGAAGGVLAHYFGERTHFSVTSDVMPGVVRSFDSFSKALEEVQNARIFGGIHFRSATHDGEVLGESVAGYVLVNKRFGATAVLTNCQLWLTTADGEPRDETASGDRAAHAGRKRTWPRSCLE